MKKNLIYAAASAIIMLLLPWCAVSFVPNDGGMMVSILLLFAVNPISAVCIGIVSGRNPKSSCFQPLLLSILFAIGAWGFLGFIVSDFLLYGAAYLVVGYLALFFTVLLRQKKDSNSAL